MDAEDLKLSFMKLTDRAMPGKDIDKFIEYLLEREPYAMDLINHRIELTDDEIKDFLSKEKKILERLKQERTKLLQEMERLAKNRKASKAYSPKFPFPPMPVFLDKSE
ncbi:MAG: hypothetical protein C0392_01595 [Syntrophus sp. (in: bacteria)]|nr:hypothetical protein [Syntrophus sp. (in: bacteria)]